MHAYITESISPNTNLSAVSEWYKAQLKCYNLLREHSQNIMSQLQDEKCLSNSDNDKRVCICETALRLLSPSE